MRIRSLAALLFGLLPMAPAWADTVYLANGRTFENVIAETTETEVKIRMPGGSLSLPRSHVLRVEASDSNFAEYVRRKEAIRRSTSAADWLALAQWAKRQGLEQGAREAALAAASLDPRIEGLAPLLRAHGYVLDQQLDRWIPYSDSMRRRGFVFADGQWLSREENAARQRARDEELERRRAERAAMQAAQATQAVREVELALANLELRERLRRTEETPAVGLPLYVYPGTWFIPPAAPCHHCGTGPRPRPEPQPPPAPRPQQPREGHGVFHVPGSLLPGTISARSHSS
ncbi:MAG TPA: hypothetical protein VKM72_07180 [Thermoanaerobaculia bacterium]|nr:hypothetical protein [Thermoanaerobaculia bacterium]